MALARADWPALAVAMVVLAPGAVRAAAPAITAFSPVSGPINTKIVITGTGFTGATLVTFDGTASQFVVNSATQITATLPATASGKLSVVTAGGTGASATSFTVTPGLLLSPTTGHESEAVTVTGSGFAAYNSIDVFFDTTDSALAVANGLGVVSVKFQVPAAAQPGAHWITLDTRATHVAAQAPFTVNVNWPMQGFSFKGAGFTPFENTLTTGNVVGLTDAWSKASGGYGNPSPFIEANGNLYVGDVTGTIRAYSGTGTLLWTAQPAGADFQSSSPATYGNLVFFGSGSTMYGYSLACHANGAACVPTWTTTIGANVVSGLTIFNGTLYAPGSDGNIYPLNPVTGVAGTPFAAYASSGSATSPVSFDSAGGYYYAEGDNLAYRTSTNASGIISFGSALSALAVSAQRVYFTSANGMIHELNGWSAATSGTGCAPQPAIANNLVYAGGCSSIGAFEASSGTLEWSVTTPGQVIGVSVANGVLYGCVVIGFGAELVAYDASYGGLLWSGGGCTTAPIIANGAVYGALADITAYTLPGLSPTYVRRKPVPFTLKPDLRLRPQVTADVAGRE